MLDPNLLLPERPRPLKRTEYGKLVALGVFEGERVELLYGTLVAMSPKDPPLASAVMQLNMLLIPPLVGRAQVRVNAPRRSRTCACASMTCWGVAAMGPPWPA